MRLAQYSAPWVEQLSRDEGRVLSSCPPTEVMDRDRLFAEQSASPSLGKVDFINK